mmetsp:Transcript_31771/g.53082  ORF Transcript_31771/g.53082 Transcript_31771/m.53082 type:complete len:84 (-) Transcript_31771:148-399(-)
MMASSSLKLILPIMYSQHLIGRLGMTPVLSRTHRRMHGLAKKKPGHSRDISLGGNQKSIHPASVETVARHVFNVLSESIVADV